RLDIRAAPRPACRDRQAQRRPQAKPPRAVAGREQCRELRPLLRRHRGHDDEQGQNRRGQFGQDDQDDDGGHDDQHDERVHGGLLLAWGSDARSTWGFRAASLPATNQCALNAAAASIASATEIAAMATVNARTASMIAPNGASARLANRIATRSARTATTR